MWTRVGYKATISGFVVGLLLPHNLEFPAASNTNEILFTVVLSVFASLFYSTMSFAHVRLSSFGRAKFYYGRKMKSIILNKKDCGGA